MKSIGNPHEHVDERIRTGKPLLRAIVEAVGCVMESDSSSSDHDEDSKLSRGVPIGEEGTKLATFEGMVARTMVPITYTTWHDVSEETKKELWEYVLMNFVLDPRSMRNEKSEGGKKVRSHNTYNHLLSRKGYAGLMDEIV
ncbi:hypothetical protein L1887_14556 [Cichorium endivia]|nr:hypothetical protein L1887_14556 [Cichorium endivia]